MKQFAKCGATVLAACLVLFLFTFSRAEDLFTLDGKATEGDTSVRLNLLVPLDSIRANVFAGGESLALRANREEDSVILELRRELKAGEELLIVLEGTGPEQGPTRSEQAVIVASRDRSRLASLREKADRMWNRYLTISGWTEKNRRVLLPLTWEEIPFVTWADEAPEIEVREENGQAVIRIFDSDLSGWQVQTGRGTPVEYTDCIRDKAQDTFLCSSGFDAVYLVSGMEKERIGISVAYERSAGFLPSHPVLNWEDDEGGHSRGMACYAWGNPRSFDGGIYTIVNDELQIYGEYDAGKNLACWYDLANDLAFDAQDNLVSGEKPEGYEIQVRH